MSNGSGTHCAHLYRITSAQLNSADPMHPLIPLRCFLCKSGILFFKVPLLIEYPFRHLHFTGFNCRRVEPVLPVDCCFKYNVVLRRIGVHQYNSLNHFILVYRKYALWCPEWGILQFNFSDIELIGLVCLLLQSSPIKNVYPTVSSENENEFQ